MRLLWDILPILALEMVDSVEVFLLVGEAVLSWGLSRSSEALASREELREALIVSPDATKLSSSTVTFSAVD